MTDNIGEKSIKFKQELMKIFFYGICLIGFVLGSFTTLIGSYQLIKIIISSQSLLYVLLEVIRVLFFTAIGLALVFIMFYEAINPQKDNLAEDLITTVATLFIFGSIIFILGVK